MSEAQQSKLDAEVSRLEREADLYKKAGTKQEAIDAFANYVKAHEKDEPFSTAYEGRANPYHSAPGHAATCCAIS